MSAILSDAKLLARLVAFDSTSRYSNLPIADFICDYLDLPGIEIFRNPSADTQKVNIVVRVKPKHAAPTPETHIEPAEGITLCGHLDVVPAEEPDWTSDPFSLTETADTYVGRGACDMKGFVALAVNAARQALKAKLAHPLVLLLTFDEEVGLLGASHFVDTWPHPFELPSSVVVGEPTSSRLVRMHKGYAHLRITLRGRSAHSGYPALGINAIEPAARMVTALAGLREELEHERAQTSNFFPEAPYASLNVAQIHGGSAVNVVPEACTIDLTVRTLPGTQSEPLLARVQQALDALQDRNKCLIEVVQNNPPLLLAEDSNTNKRLAEFFGQPESLGVSYSSDAGVLQKMGLECALWGPGNIEVAHKPNESMPKKEFADASTTLERMIQEFCA